MNMNFFFKAGFIGKLTIKIPWAQLMSQAVVIHIEDLYLLAGPAPETEYDVDLEAKRAEKIKMAIISAYEQDLSKQVLESELRDAGTKDGVSLMLIVCIA